jgi:hypothetical protein
VSQFNGYVTLHVCVNGYVTLHVCVNGYVRLHVCVFPSQGIHFHFVVIVITVCGSFRVEWRVVYVRIVVVGMH